MLHTHTHTHIQTYTHTYIHTYIHTHIHTHTPRYKCDLWRSNGRRLCTSGVSSQCESPAVISDWSRDGLAMAGGVSRYLTFAGPSGGQKTKGENPAGEFGIGYTVSFPSRQVRELGERCCSCTWYSTCSTTGLSAQVCKCCNAGRQCTGCYCWGKNRNKGQLMPSPTTT